MNVVKQNVDISFIQGLDTKTDPFRVSFGKFLGLSNSVFKRGGLLSKRNGFQQITILPDTTTSLTTFNGNLISVGESVGAYSADSNTVVDGGKIQPLSLKTIPMVRSSTSQQTVDSATASSGLCVTAWQDSGGGSYYQVVDSVTSQIIVPSINLGAAAMCPRTFVLGNNFIVTYLTTISSTVHLQYIAIPLSNPASPRAAVDISTTVASDTTGYDGVVANNFLYIAVNGSDGGGAIRITYLDSFLNLHSTKIITGHTGDLISVTADNTLSSIVVWVSFYDNSSMDCYSTALNPALLTILAPTLVLSGETLNNITSVAKNNILTIFADVDNAYTFSPNAQTDYVESNTCTSTGTVGSAVVVLRGVGLFSKAFYFADSGVEYLFVVYGQAYQPTYFLIDFAGNIYAKFAYSNAGGYPINQILSSATVVDDTVSCAYLYRDQLVAVNKSQGVADVNGIYAQAGINLLTIDFTDISNTQEIGNNLNITGGILWAYDGAKVTEQGFNVWPEDIQATFATSGGDLTDQQYFYQVCYEWTDAQGNLFRSAPSVPLEVTVAGGSGSAAVTLEIPTLRQTYKSGVRIVIYRWSAAQEVYYQITSIQTPLLNDPTEDSVEYVDTQSDADILGNVIIYTTGGVVEDIGAPSFVDIGLFDSRVFGIDSEDRNLLWYSKQVIEGTPVEFSDLFTLYIAPTTGAQGSTGDTYCVTSMDSNLILFKKDAIYYLSGSGPDNTGANSGYSQPIFITSTVGCSNKRSIVMTPNGLMFQSDKGIWLLGRDLSTTYIGAPVEEFNSSTIEASLVVPGTNEVRFTLDNGITLMYDYYYAQWGTFIGIPAISSTIYQGLHTFVNEFGQVYQENPGVYLDGSSPVLMSFVSNWFNAAGLQGYQRAYFMYMLATFYSPHKVQIQIAYDYAPYPSQNSIITPDNYSPAWGGDQTWGNSTPWGGSPTLEQWRVFFQQQKCQAFQIYFNEIFDSSYGQPASVGLTVSGLNLVIGTKKSYVPIMAKNSVG